MHQFGVNDNEVLVSRNKASNWCGTLLSSNFLKLAVVQFVMGDLGIYDMIGHFGSIKIQ